jgi:hypothetical protein
MVASSGSRSGIRGSYLAGQDFGSRPAYRDDERVETKLAVRELSRRVRFSSRMIIDRCIADAKLRFSRTETYIVRKHRR